ncbi:MAG TPA: toxin-antitoxin system HicB family antitoxin [Sporichthyaceae bacterium]|jgi:hypothetical protein|nr:toxin-antitoxin system HicB family antitoxin [Sporichthyaceae bacterium]
MDLTGHVARLHAELLAAAAVGDQPTREAAERLAAALDAVTRLTFLEALAEAAEEITRELAPGSVEVRLRGRQPEFVVNPAPVEFRAPTPGPGPFRPVGEFDDPTARLTLRLPEQLKGQVESAASAEGLSVNTWLVRTVAGALHPGEPGGPAVDWPGGRQQLCGWVR